MEKVQVESVQAYIELFSEEVQERLVQLRSIIQTRAQDAVESISYGMPAYKLGGKPLLYFAAFKNHIGFYATPSAQINFKKELTHYKQGKGSVQFPLTEPLPVALITEIVDFRVTETRAKLSKKH